MKTFVQIGTNDGRDEFCDVVKHIADCRIFLIEPYAGLNLTIKRNYKFAKGTVVIINKAICENEEKTCKLYLNPSIYNKSDRLETRHTQHFSLKENAPEAYEITVPCMSFMEFVDMVGLVEIDYLQIDTEGADLDIIKSIDFNRISIPKIIYEYYYHGKSNEIQTYLESKGYTVTVHPTDAVNRVAVKI